MATSTDNRQDRTIDADRRILAGWDRQEAWDRWLEATVNLQQTYLEWLNRSVRVFAPQMSDQN